MFRFLNKMYARVFGYFWLPCPVCKEYFGGHETGYEAASADDGRAYVVCQKPSCNAEARRQRQAAPQALPNQKPTTDNAWKIDEESMAIWRANEGFSALSDSEIAQRNYLAAQNMQNAVLAAFKDAATCGCWVCRERSPVAR